MIDSNSDIDLNIIIPMAGLGSRFTEYGFKENKYLLPVDINLTKMIDNAILTLVNSSENLKIQFIFIIKEDGVENIELRQHLKNICEKHNYMCIILGINYLTEGPASTAFLAKDIITNNKPLIISNSDQILDWNFYNFFNFSNKYEGCVLTYVPPYKIVLNSVDKHSFVRYDDNMRPIEFVEKKAISNDALVGVHYYSSGLLFIKAYEYIYTNNIRAPNGEFYLSYTYQALINMNYTVGTYKLNKNEYFYPVGEPVDYFNYYNKNCPIIKYELYNFIKNVESLNYIPDIIPDNIVSFHFGKNGEIMNHYNVLCIIIKGKTNISSKIFISDSTHTIKFEEDSVYITFLLRENHSFSEIDLTKYTRGWIIGNFLPSVEKNKYCEIGYLSHSKNSGWDFHYHKQAIEFNILVKGKMVINNVFYHTNDIFIINKNIISCPIFLEDCEIICIKIPSIQNDKYII
jgi:dTDP-glucose pyrophosphorylase